MELTFRFAAPLRPIQIDETVCNFGRSVLWELTSLTNIYIYMSVSICKII